MSVRHDTLSGIEHPSYLGHLKGKFYFRRSDHVDYIAELKYRLSVRWPQEIKHIRVGLCVFLTVALTFAIKCLVDSVRSVDSCGGEMKPDCIWSLGRARKLDDPTLLMVIGTDIFLVVLLLPLCMLSWLNGKEALAKLVFGIEGYEALIR